MHKGVVLDEPQAKALLYYAIKEKIISIDANEDNKNDCVGDFFIKRILSNPPTAEAKDMVFEQLVIGGKVYIPFSIPHALRGDIFENGLVDQVPKFDDEGPLSVDIIDPSILISMLEMRGVAISAEQIDILISDFMKEYKEFKEISGGIEIPDDMTLMFQKIFSIEHEEVPKFIMEKWDSVKKVYNKVKPIIDVSEMYSKIIRYSLKLDALSSLPVCSSDYKKIDFRTVEDTDDRIYLMKFISEKVNATPIGISLKQTIEKAESEEAEYYRCKLDEMAQTIKTQDSNRYAGVIEEIEKTSEDLKRADDYEKQGKLVTVIGLPLSVTPLSLIPTAMSGVCLAGEYKNRMNNKWAMFGRS